MDYCVIDKVKQDTNDTVFPIVEPTSSLYSSVYLPLKSLMPSFSSWMSTLTSTSTTTSTSSSPQSVSKIDMPNETKSKNEMIDYKDERDNYNPTKPTENTEINWSKTNWKVVDDIKATIQSNDKERIKNMMDALLTDTNNIYTMDAIFAYCTRTTQTDIIKWIQNYIVETGYKKRYTFKTLLASRKNKGKNKKSYIECRICGNLVK